jgi:serine/threonine protein phosphatase PrpC
MGCATSSGADGKAENVTGSNRRRLSVSQIGKEEGGNNTEDNEDERGLITALNESNIVELLQNAGEDRKFSIGSNTDAGKTSFANKTVQQMGDEVNAVDLGIGYTCRKGLKPESPNQDSWGIINVGEYSIYGVYDGHGQKGHDVSNFVKENMPKIIVRDQRFKTDDMKPMMTETFKKMQSLIAHQDRNKKISAQMSGTTATVAIHNHAARKLLVSHVADSTCVLGFIDGKKLKGRALTRDHKPDLPDEKARIIKAGGRVVFDGYANHRVYAKAGRYPGLNMSRCLGDLLGHSDAGCSAEPEVNEFELSESDFVLLLCSDGVWEFISPDEAVAMVSQYPKDKAMQAADYLAKQAWDRWIHEEGGAVVDDITVVIIYLPPGCDAAVDLVKSNNK